MRYSPELIYLVMTSRYSYDYSYVDRTYDYNISICIPIIFVGEIVVYIRNNNIYIDERFSRFSKINASDVLSKRFGNDDYVYDIDKIKDISFICVDVRDNSSKNKYKPPKFKITVYQKKITNMLNNYYVVL